MTSEKINTKPTDQRENLIIAELDAGREPKDSCPVSVYHDLNSYPNQILPLFDN